MYRFFRVLVLRLLRAPVEPPEAPSGSHASVRVFRASPRYLTCRLIGLFVGFTGAWIGEVVLLVSSIVGDEPAGIVLGVLGIPSLLIAQTIGYLAVRVDYDLRYYIVTDRSMRVRQGALVVREMTITHANVQNLRVVQGPILRLFGLRDLEVDTAGGGERSKRRRKGGDSGGHSFRMAGIENAEEVRDLILEHVRRRGAGAGLGDPDDVDAARAAALPVADALLGPLARVRDAAAGLRRAAEARA